MSVAKFTPAKLTPAQRRALEDVRDHRTPYWRVHGRSQHGGMTSVIRIIRARGWAEVTNYDADGERNVWQLTTAGKAALEGRTS